MPINETIESSILEGSDPTCRSVEAEVQLNSSNIYRIENGRTKWVFLYSFAFSVGAIEIFFIASGWWFLFRRQGDPMSVEDGYRAISSQFKKFTFPELKKATKNFYGAGKGRLWACLQGSFGG